MSRARLDADDAASLLRELAWLRKRGGFTAARLVHAPIVDWTARCFSDSACFVLQAAFFRSRNSLSTSSGVRYPRAE